MTDAYSAGIQQTPVIDIFGNMNLQGRSGQVFAVSFQDATGALVDISGFLYVFEVEGYATVPLTMGQTVYSQTLTIPDGVWGVPLNAPVNWTLRDVTNTPSMTVRSGILNVYGFESDPP